MSGKTVLTVGAVLRGDDAAGPMLAKMLQDEPVEGWDVIDGGQTPEDFTSVVRRSEPDLLLVVDAAAMGLPTGSIRRLTADDVVTDFLVTTHSLPISFLLNELEDCCGQVVFLGIQPGQMEFFSALSPEVMASVEEIYGMLSRGSDFSEVPSV
ncbi:MAG: hydrogenase maturation peptidase HycI [Coriobacteriales bacterium]|jgi:hydrogenase 3 maturation protease